MLISKSRIITSKFLDFPGFIPLTITITARNGAGYRTINKEMFFVNGMGNNNNNDDNLIYIS